MPRSMRESDDEVDVKVGRKTRGLAGSVAVESPLRRSSRIKPTTKHYESSPESSLSDASNVSNTQITRATRRRVGTMDNSAATEKNRTLRSRRNSVASDVSEPTDTDVLATPTKKTKGIAVRDILNKPNNRASKRSTRAGSEAKSSPPISRVTRRMRASSMEPEGNMEVTETPPIKSKRRASVLPSEATVAEEKEVMKIAVIALDRTLPNVKEINESGLEKSLKSVRSKKSTSDEDLDEKRKEDNIRVKEAHNNAADEPPSNTSEDVKVDVPVDNEKTISHNDGNVAEKSENFSADTVTKTEASVNNAAQVLSQTANEDTSKELGLKNENILNVSIKEHDEDVSNKENHTANIISDTQNKEDIISNTLLQSPKPLSASNINANKLTKEVCKSPSVEASLLAKRRYSKELPDATNDTALPTKEVSSNADLANNSAANKNVSVNEEDADSSDNMQKLIVSTDTDSLSEVPLNESTDKNALPVEMCSNSSLEDSIQIVECVDSVDKADNYESIETNKNLEKPVEKTYSDDECNQDANIAMDISTSHVEDTANKTEDSKEDGINQITSTDDKSEAKEEAGKLNKSVDLIELDEVECTQGNLSKPSDVSLVANTESIALKNESETTVHDLQETGEANNSPIRGNKMPETSHDARTSPENSTYTNKNEDVTDMVNITESSAVAETPAETTEEVPEKGELSKKTSLSDDPSTSRKSVDKVQSNNKEKKSDGKGETPKKNLESMEVDDNDSDTNTANLFQDIPADEWKEKGADVDKDSVHSMSTERLENESENECDLILVDREAWLAAENIKLKKENEPFDYDSDDTVVLKSRRDSLKATGEGKMTLDVILEDECKMNVSKRKSLNTSSKRRSTKQAETGDREDVEEDPGDIGLGAEDTEGIEEAKDTECTRKRKSISKETDERSTPKCNVSLQKSVGEKSLSESQQATETKETSDKSFTNSPLSKSKLSDNTPKKRKSLNKSVQEMDDKAEISSECEFEKKRKSLNKSKLKESDIAETESSNENIIIRGKKNKSSNNSPKKRVKTRQLDPNLIEESDNECKESEVNEKKSSSTKKTLHRNYSTAVNLESDSDASRDNIDSQDSEDESVKWPKFLYGGESNSDSDNENESNKSIDSDIRREYNLDGEEVTEFADDDVPGDECRASETESSDPDDDGSDLLDFVVDDDEDDEAEEEKEEDEDGDQEETKTVENEEDLNNEEDANEDDEEEEVVVDEEEEVVVDEEVADEDEEMKVTEEVDSIEEKEQSEDEQESVEKVNKSLDTSKKGMNKLRKSADSSLTPMTENNKGKKRRLKTDTSLTEKDEKECNLSTISLSTSLKGKKSKQKRVFNEFTDDAKQLLNDSPTILNTKTEKLFKSMECSTPKTSSSKLEKFSINQHTPDVTLEASCKNLSREIREGKEDTSPDKEEAQDKAQKIEKNSKKLRKLKDKENPMHRSLPSELIELVEKTNVSSVTSSKVTELNKTTPIPNSESPTVMHLRKERLNDSAPELKLSSKSRRKSIKNSTNKLSNSLKEFKEENAAVEEQAEEPTTEVNDSLKKKLLKVADNILESDRQKKRKKRKQVAVEQNSVQFSEVNFEENINSRITKKKQQRDDSTGIVVKNEQEKETSVDKKKKKKKKKKVVSMEVDAPVVNESPENLIETDLENNNEPIHNDEKKKKKKGKKIKDGIESQVPAKKKAKNGKKIAVPYEEVSVIKASKKRQKWSEDVASESEQVSIEKVPKKKQKLSKDAALEQEEASDKKLRKKKQKLLSHDTNSQVEKSSPKKLSKKKDKLSSENVMAAIKSQQSGDVASDSDEGPEVVAFSKARDEALGIIKRTADGIKANKEIKKKKQREHLERMQAEKEIKIQKLESKSQMKKSKVVEMQKKSVKRLPDDVLENLSDIPSKPLKKRKLCQFDDEVLPSRSTFNFMDKETRDIHIEDDILSLPSSAGSTTQFDVVNLQKLKKKKKAAVVSFRQKMLARNSRHPVSAYLMYLEKQKASDIAEEQPSFFQQRVADITAQISLKTNYGVDYVFHAVAFLNYFNSVFIFFYQLDSLLFIFLQFSI